MYGWDNMDGWMDCLFTCPRRQVLNEATFKNQLVKQPRNIDFNSVNMSILQ